MMPRRRHALLLPLLLLGVAAAGRAQPAAGRDFVRLDERGPIPPALAAPVTLTFAGVPLRVVVDSITRLAKLGFVADPTLPGLDRPVTLSVRRVSAGVALARALAGSGLAAMVSPTGQVVLVARAAATGAALRGVVRDAESGTPIDGARVEVAALSRSVVARETGRFEIPLPAAPADGYTVRVTRLGYAPVVLPNVPADGAPLDVTMTRASVPLASVIVTPGTFGILQQGVAGSQSFSRRQIEAVPQIGEDIYRAINRLPGIAADDFSSDFRVRGAPGTELYTTLDGMELERPFHLQDFGGSFSILDVQAIGAVELTTGGAAADVGHRLTGSLAMHSREPRTDGAHVSAGISVMNARAMTEGGFAGGRGGWMASARRGYLDLALKLGGANDSLSPRYGDAFAKVHYDLPSRWLVGGRVTAHALHASDHFDYEEDDGHLASKYGSDYGWVTWAGPVGGERAAAAGEDARVRQSTVLSAARTTRRRDGGMLSTINGDGVVHDDRRFSALGVRQDWTFAATPRVVFRFGADARAERARYEYESHLTRGVGVRIDSGGVRERVTVSDSARSRLTPAGTRAGAYAAWRVRPLDPIIAEVGVRLDRAVTGERSTLPRLNVAWQPREGTTVRGALGRAAQSQSPGALRVEDRDTVLHAAKRATHAVLGLDQAVSRTVTARAELYARAGSAPWPYAANNASGDIPELPEVTWDRVQVAPDSVRARGLELMLRRDGGRRLDWSVSYALAEARERVNGTWIPGLADQRHALNLDVSAHPTDARWRLSLAGTWHSGWPYTPGLVVVDTLVNTPQRFSITGRWRPGEFNAARLPHYRRMDVRWTRYLDTRRGRGSVFAEVYNLLGTENVRGYFTNVNYDPGRHLVSFAQGTSGWLPRLPAAGVSWEF